MNWIAIIDNVTEENNKLVVYVTFTNQVDQKFQDIFPFQGATKEGIEATIQGRLDILNSTAKPVDIPLGPFTETVIVKTPEELARSEYNSNLRLLEHMDAAILAEVKTNADKDYVDLKQLLKDTFIPSYIDLF